MQAKQTTLLGLTLQELTALAEESGEPSYRGRQLFEAVYGQRVESVEQISTLPQAFRTTRTRSFIARLATFEFGANRSNP